jgi:hypothetical protein
MTSRTRARSGCEPGPRGTYRGTHTHAQTHTHKPTRTNPHAQTHTRTNHTRKPTRTNTRTNHTHKHTRTNTHTRVFGTVSQPLLSARPASEAPARPSSTANLRHSRAAKARDTQQTRNRRERKRAAAGGVRVRVPWYGRPGRVGTASCIATRARADARTHGRTQARSARSRNKEIRTRGSRCGQRCSGRPSA